MRSQLFGTSCRSTLSRRQLTHRRTRWPWYIAGDDRCMDQQEEGVATDEVIYDVMLKYRIDFGALNASRR